MMKKALLTVFFLACGGSDAQPHTQVAATSQPPPPPPEVTASAAPSAAPAEERAPSSDVADAGPVGILGAIPFDGGGSFASLAHDDYVFGVEGESGLFGSAAGAPVDPHHPRRSSPHATVRQGTMTVNGRLPPEVVRRIVRAHFPMFRLCYEQGLSRNPTLAGRIGLKFVIGPNGDVTSATDGGSDIASPDVSACVLARVRTFMFPKPERGQVTVVFPLVFGKS